MYGCNFCHRKFHMKLLPLKINGKNNLFILVYSFSITIAMPEFYSVSVRSYGIHCKLPLVV